jgi:predicted phage terminase large subunit-like protein
MGHKRKHHLHKNSLIFKKKRLAELLIHDHMDHDYKIKWEKTARPSQLEPNYDWKTWLIMAGRGFGKTQTGAHVVLKWVHEKGYKNIALISQSMDEVVRVMVNGPSGIIASGPANKKPTITGNQLHFHNGAIATFFGANHIQKLRGPQFDAVWIDEMAKFKKVDELWEQVMLSLRLGQNPQCVITTTPRPAPLLKKLIDDPNIHVTRGSTMENKDNLAPSFIQTLESQYKGTRLEAQEIHAQLLMEVDGALWNRSMIVYKQPTIDFNQVPELDRIVIGVDPAETHHDHSDETGIIVAGIDRYKNIFILDDLSGRYSPMEWGKTIVDAYHRYKADRVVAEVNKGGDMVESVIKSVDDTVSYKAVRATRGKITRAEPISALYEQNRIFHSRPFEQLENQLCEFTSLTAQKSPDRLDAMVWAASDLVGGFDNIKPFIWSIK